MTAMNSEPVLKMGGAGDSPAPVGDSPTGTAAMTRAKRPLQSLRTIAPVPSGESPDGTGGSPVLPKIDFPNTLSRFLSLAAGVAALSFCVGCRPPGKPTTADIELKPEEVRDFAALYQQNCVGCHGQDGKGNSALALANPVYLAIASDDVIRRATASGVRDSLMPAFARSSGGMLTDDQIEILVHEMRARWKAKEALGAPPYAANEPGDPARGAAAYAAFCAGCHGPEGKGTKKGSSIIDDSFLALVTDQSLRTTVIAGRPDLGHPDWRNYVPDRPMTPQEVTDVVSWLVAHRKANAGQPYPGNEQAQKN